MGVDDAITVFSVHNFDEHFWSESDSDTLLEDDMLSEDSTATTSDECELSAWWILQFQK